MKKVILLGSVLASMLLADGVGVREAIKKQGFRLGAVSETQTRLEYERLGIQAGGGVILGVCKNAGGDNIYAIKGNAEIPFLVNGEKNPEAGIGLKGLFNENVFSGEKNYTFVCKNDNTEIFKATERAYMPYKDNIGLTWYRGYILIEHSPEKMPEVVKKPIGEKKGELVTERIGSDGRKEFLVQQVTFADPSDIKTEVAKKTAQFKSNYNKIEGNIQYLGTYNGIDSSSKCDLVSVIKKTDGSKNLITNNYKVCKNKVVSLGVSEPTNINNKELDTAIKTTAKICQQSGSAVTEVDKFTLSCRALRDKDVCTVEVSVLNSSNQLVDKKILNGCN